MSASQKLRDWSLVAKDERREKIDLALPEIIAVIEAAEILPQEPDPPAVYAMVRHDELRDLVNALAALEEKLS